MLIAITPVDALHASYLSAAAEESRRPRKTYDSLTAEAPEEYIARMLDLRDRAETAFIDRVAQKLARKSFDRLEVTDIFRARSFLMFMSASHHAARAISNKLQTEFPSIMVSDYAAWNIFTHGHSDGNRYLAYDLPGKMIERLYEDVIAGTHPNFKMPEGDITSSPWFVPSPYAQATFRLSLAGYAPVLQ